MKTIVAFFFPICLLGIVHLNATVWRVNNNTGIDADFTTLSAAVNGANAGDTLYLEASPNGYGSGIDTINKKLTVIGPGYFITANDSTQANINGAGLGRLVILADTVVIQGVSFGLGAHGASLIYVAGNEVTIRRCHISGGSFSGRLIQVASGYNGVVIKQNYFRSTLTGGGSTTGGILVGSNSSANIENNFIWINPGGAGSVPAIELATGVSPNCVIRNNVITGPCSIQNTSNFKNNILMNGSISGSYSGDYNMCDGTQFTGQPNSILNANMNNIFVNNGGTEDNDYELACPGGPDDGCGDGEFGHDMGMFGGPSPYKLSGIPDIPAIFQFGGTGSASDNVPLQINIKAKSHN